MLVKIMKGQMKIKLLYARYNMYHNSIDITTYYGLTVTRQKKD